MPEAFDFFSKKMKNITFRFISRDRRGLGLILGVILAVACGKKPKAPPGTSSAPVPNLTMPIPRPKPPGPDAGSSEMRDAEIQALIKRRYASDPAEMKAMLEEAETLNARGDAEGLLAEQIHRIMVDPAPVDFKPEKARRKIRLKLILESSRISRGGRPRFRLELTNVGSDPIEYRENQPSVFVKGGSLLDSSRTIHFFLTGPHGKRFELMYRRPPRSLQTNRSSPLVLSPAGMTEAEKKDWFIKTNAMSQARSSFSVRLLPGETLHSLGDDDSLGGNYKTLFTTTDFNEAGAYNLQVRLDDRPRPLTLAEIKDALNFSTPEETRRFHDEQLANALGPAVSNECVFEVGR